jgi:Uma2 family endonuclease
MVQTPVRQITLEEFLALPDTKPASEYIDGKIIQKPMPQGQHSILQIELGMEINQALRRKGIATAFPELRCSFGGRAIVPDVVIFEDAKIPYDKNGDIENVFSIPPDWTIEILSPEQSTTKVLKNISHYLAYGSQMGWLIDPADRSVFICMPVGEPTEGNRTFQIIDEPSTILPVPEFAKSIQLTVEQLFSWIKKKV